MKLLIFCPYYPPHIGGLESHADEFNKYLSQEGVDITVFTPKLPKEAPENEIRHNKVKIIRFPAFEIIPSYPLPKFWTIKFWQLFLDLFKIKFDIVISRTRFFNTSLLALIYSKMKKIKWIHIEHGSDFVSLNNPILSKIAKLYDYTFGKLILKLSDHNIANSIASANFCKKLAPKKNCEVIYRGVEIEKIINIPPNSELKEKYSDNLIITFIGRLIDGKGVSDLLEAISKINYDKIKCFVIGDGPQSDSLKKLTTELNISDKVIFFGYKKPEEAIAILKISDIFVNPSYNEGLPSSVVEAALCKKAIIATNVGGTPEIFTNEKSGFLIEPRKIDILREKMEKLINDKNLRERFGMEAYDETIKTFDWKNSIRDYLEIINRELNNGKKRGF